MRNLKATIVPTALIMIFALFVSGSVFGQTYSTNETYRVHRGERPPIDLQTVPSDAFEPGVMLIKFKPEYATSLEQNPAMQLTDGSIRFNLSAVDNLNDLFSAQSVKQEFRHEAFNNSFTARHKAWGFHLWYRLTFDHKSDIKTIVAQYQSLVEVEYAAPEFKKRLIEGINPGYVENQGSAITNPATSWVPNDTRLGEQWHYNNTGQTGGTPGKDIKLFDAWDIEKGNSNVIVAIVDQGIQFTHPDLAGNMWPGIGFNFVAGNSTVVPGDHGTHVAGTVAAVNNNGLGVAGIAGGSGTNDGVRLMSCQVFTASSSGGFHLAPVWAADNGASISQNSWGYTSAGVYDQNVLDAIDYFNTNGGGNALIGGGITIFAAGNNNSSGAWYPGFYSGTLSVAATNHSDVKAWYSNYDTWVDISAPGGETNSVTSQGVLSTITNNSYAFYQGTSMACPHVSGVAALIISLVYGQLTAEDVADILVTTTDNHYAANPSFTGKLGSGRLNAHQALIAAQNYLSGVLNPTSVAASTVSSSAISVSWNKNSSNDNVMLAWSENNIFGTPEPGMIYQVGSTLPGGGVVLYKGLNTNYQHTGLTPATPYYYKAWSYNNENTYSSGRTVSAATACEIFQLPFSQGFEESASVPLCWEQEFVVGSTSWTVGAGNGGSNPPSAFEGSKNAYFKIQTLGSGGTSTRLVSPEMNLAGYESTTLTFRYTNQRRTFLIFNFQDELRVRYRTSTSAPWQTLATYNTNVANWTEVTLPLPNASGTYYIAFEAISNLGHGVCVDNVSVTGVGASMPVVVTSAVSNITAISAIASGNVTGDGGSAVSQRGVCWSTLPNPNITGNHTIEGSGTGAFTSQLTGLEPNTTYYVRAYATNVMGTAYGSQQTFTTLGMVLPGDANCDGLVNVIDVISTVNYILGTNPQPFCFDNADTNGDNLVNVIDVIGTVNIILGGTNN